MIDLRFFLQRSFLEIALSENSSTDFDDFYVKRRVGTCNEAPYRFHNTFTFSFKELVPKMSLFGVGNRDFSPSAECNNFKTLRPIRVIRSSN
jgi:hypothetical protein